MFVTNASGPSRSHAHLAIALTAELDPTETGRVHAELDGLAAIVRPLWDAPPGEQLVGCAAAIAERFRVCGDHTLDDLLLPRVLARRVGHPLLLAIVAADVGRRAGLPVGLVECGREQQLAHVVLPQPVAADPGTGFALCDLRGREDTVRWLGPTDVAVALLTLVAETALETGEPGYAMRAEQARRALSTQAGGDHTAR